MIASLFLLAATFASVSSQSVSVRDCSVAGSLFTIQSLDFTPTVPVPGTNGTLHSVYSVPEIVNGGSARYYCSLNGLPVYDETFDLCTQTVCPIAAGVHDDHSTSEIPSAAGKVVCTIDWKGLSGEPYMCIQTIMKLSLKKGLRGSGDLILSAPSITKQLVLYQNKSCPLFQPFDSHWNVYAELDSDSQDDSNSSGSDSSFDFGTSSTSGSNSTSTTGGSGTSGTGGSTSSGSGTGGSSSS